MTFYLQGCFFFDYFKDNETGTGETHTAQNRPVLGRDLGTKAGGINESALSAVYGVTTTHPPAPIRPDPDLHMRRLILQFRPEGTAVARVIGLLEPYRELLGGASQDFSKKPQEDYDATSLLATLQAAEIVCEGLVDPNSNTHPGWSTILPADPSNAESNIRFLMQHLTGIPDSQISAESLSQLQDLLDLSASGGSYELSHYIPVCAALTVDAQALYF